MLLYRRLASRPIVGEIPWRDLHLWWGDERAVGPESPQSNYRLAREALLATAPIPADNVHRIEGELGAVRAAELYERELSEAMGASGHFDLVLLGIGNDGHTASIFPEALAQMPEDGLVTTVQGGEPAVERVTLTLSAINSADEVVMLADGASKAEAVGRVLMGDTSLPAARIKPKAGNNHLHIFLDRAAAATFDEQDG